MTSAIPRPASAARVHVAASSAGDGSGAVRGVAVGQIQHPDLQTAWAVSLNSSASPRYATTEAPSRRSAARRPSSHRGARLSRRRHRAQIAADPSTTSTTAAQADS